MVDISLSAVPFVTTFLFVFAVVYAMLVKTKVIEQKGSSVIIAAVFGFFTAIVPAISEFLMAIIPIASILLLVLFLLMFMQSLIKGDKDALPMLAALGIVLLVLAAQWSRISGVLPLPAGLSADNMLWIIGIIIILLIFVVAYRA